MSDGYKTYVWKGNNDMALMRWPIDARVKQMSLGVYHSAFLTHDGQVFCCGQNLHGQLGIGNNSGTYMEPVATSCLDEEETSSVAVGLYHTVCGTKSGNVYCWGDSTHGQCASIEVSHFTTPICVASFNSPVEKVDCCSTASVALLADGRLYAWGTGSILQDTASLKQQVLLPSPFRFIEDRTVLDVSCGANFIIAVIKKAVITEKKLVTKNNYVVVHKSDSELEAFNSAELKRGDSNQNCCPLGLEIYEEHVFLSSSEQNSPAATRKSSGNRTRSPSLKSYTGSKFSRASSLNSLGGSADAVLGEVEGSGSSEDVKSRSNSSPAVSSQSVINVNPSEAEQWLKDRIGSQFSIRESEVPPLTSPVLVEENPQPAQDNATSSRMRDKLPHYVESMWNSLTSSSQAVSTAVHSRIVSKIPILDKLTTSPDLPPSGDDSMGLTPLVSHSLSVDAPEMESKGDDSQPMYKSVAARALRRAESSSVPSSPNHSRNVSRAGSRTNIASSSQEFHSSACIATEVWSWGAGDHGQLGHGDCLDRLQPCAISSLSDCQVYRVVCSQHSVLVQTTDGKAYGWGDNSNNQIAYRGQSMVLHPTIQPISLRLPVIDIALGTDHALLQTISPSSLTVKGGMFYTGAGSRSELGTRLEFTKNLGYKLLLSGGPNGVSSMCVKHEALEVFKELGELQASEIWFYRMLLDILAELVEPIVQSDQMSGLLDSSFGECLKSMFENLFRLVDKIGLNTQELSSVTEPEDLNKISLVGNDKAFMRSFTSYANHFHDFLAMNGLTHLVDKVKPVLLINEEAITALLERCQLEFSDELIVKVCVLLQLPLRRVSEYHERIERIQLQLEDGSMLSSCLNSLEQEKLHLSSQYNLAESTRIFWEKCQKSISSVLKEPHRRLVRESKSLALSLVGGSKLYKNWFVLFNDVFVHIQGNTHKVYPLEKLWIEAGVSVGTQPENEIKFIMPEASLSVQASSTAEKAEWMWILSQTITLQLSSHKPHLAEPTVVNHRGYILRTVPAIRVASHMFYKSGPLQGAVYKGKWRRGLIHGEGQMIWADGRVYVGQFTDGEQTGYGKLTCKVKGKLETMEGHWKNGKLHGFAKTRFANGDLYTGFYSDNQYNGHGVLKQKSSASVYVGEWKEGRYHGYGVLDSKGEKYLGQWVRGVKQGPGLQITLDGCYMEGNFTNNKLIGQGLIMTADDTYYEGSFTGLSEVNGRGVMVMSSGDWITGTFDGSWSEGIKVNGVYSKPADEVQTTPLSSTLNLPKCFSSLSTPHDLKWVELFHHARVALGAEGNQTEPVDCEKAWDKVAVLFANLRTTQSLKKKKLYSEQLEKIPEHNLPTLSLEHYKHLRKYLNKACDCELHPLGLLLRNLVDVYRTSYSGTGTHRRLLIHAREELLSIANRYYDIIRILFPELPADRSARKILGESSLSRHQHQPPSDDFSSSTDGSASDIELTSSAVVVELDFEDSEIITPTLLIFPMLLPKIYEPLFHLYALQNEASDEQYWCRIQKFNKQCDLTLLSYLGIPEKFWLLNDGNVIDSSLKSLDIQNECYAEAIDTLQRLSTCLTPAEKLHIVHRTFDKMNRLVKENLSDDFVWSMDDLFPVFLFVVIRSRIRYLGSEIQMMDELVDDHLEYGELGLMFTTLKACHLQIQTEKLL